MFGNHGLCGLPEEGAHEKSPKCLSRNLGDLGEFCKGLRLGVVSVFGYMLIFSAKYLLIFNILQGICLIRFELSYQA